ncbi:O-antigen/teichoic acid export membrane protein [Marinimicrobium koreense]|jgi:O-antigen/teichoic acid export membrane protein|uniref:O-antigen/teichoic acid export membrane protein n=1 Tax=Marinimicrobium koreense TaxID=306545 RepID=A0A3N1NSA8_9GAMM|nr:oligosaccharide flippase family protein [Marinimicrobium koreense]ROQ18068.1 O-antigen/teichoic acid export membrane protein [Marinimicrobium koreense]
MIPQRSSKKRAAQHIAIYSAGTIIRQLAGFIMLPIYTSYLTPADYGVVGLLVVMVSLFELLIGARFAQAVPRFFYEQESSEGQNTVVSTALVITFSISILSTTLVFIFSNTISNLFFGTPSFYHYVSIYGFILLFGAVEVYGLTFFRLRESPILFIVNSISKLILQLVLNIVFVVNLEMGVAGVVYSSVISSLVFAIISAFYILSHTGLSVDYSLIRRFIIFSWPLWLAGLAGLYIGSSNRFFIRIFSDLDQVGLFELAGKFAAIIPMLFWKPFSQWWQTERFKIYQSEDKGISVYPKVFDGMGILLVIIALGISVTSGPIIKLMSSPLFYQSILAIPPLVYAALLTDMTNFFTFSFLVSDKNIYITYIKYLSALFITVLYFILVPIFGYIGASYSLLMATIFVFLLSYNKSKKFFDNNIKIKYFLSIVSVSFVFSIIDQCFSLSIDSLTILLSLKVILIFVFFLLIYLSLFFKKETKIVVDSFIKTIWDVVFAKVSR